MEEMYTSTVVMGQRGLAWNERYPFRLDTEGRPPLSTIVVRRKGTVESMYVRSFAGILVMTQMLKNYGFLRYLYGHTQII